MHRSAVGLVLLLAAVPCTAGEEPEPEPALPHLEDVGEIRVDMPGGDTNMVFAPSPAGRFATVSFAPRADAGRRADTWTSLRLLDVENAREKGAWDDLETGRLPPAFSPDGRLFAFGTRKDDMTLTVQVLSCAAVRGMTHDVPHVPGSQGYAEVCGVSPDAQRVAIREPADAEGNRSLLVHELAKSRRVARFPGLTSPSEDASRAGVVLTGPFVAFHAIAAHGGAPHDGNGTASRLRLVELDTSRAVADLTACSSRTTARFAFTKSGKRLVAGTGDFAIESVDVTSGERTTLLDASDLKSQYLEVVLSADGRRVVAWSDERKLVLARDLDAPVPIRVDLDVRARVEGVSADGRWVYVRDFERGLLAVDLDAGAVAGVVTPELADWARIMPDGRHLVSGTRDDHGWTFRVQAIRVP